MRRYISGIVGMLLLVYIVKLMGCVYDLYIEHNHSFFYLFIWFMLGIGFLDTIGKYLRKLKGYE